MEEKNSGYGLASIGLSGLSAVALAFVVIIAGVMESSSGGMDPNAGSTMAVGLAIIFFLFLSAIGGVLGIVGLLQKDRKKVVAILGLSISAITILGILGLMVIGFVAGG
jgi:hypothetical protein